MDIQKGVCVEYEKNPVKAIRKKCLECSGDYIKEVENCPVVECAIWPFRFGKNPYRKIVLSDEEIEIRRERMKSLRNSQLEAKSKTTQAESFTAEDE